MTTDLSIQELELLSRGIGCRLAGSPEELQAAEIMAAKFLEYGAAAVTLENFPVVRRAVTSEKLEVELNGKWHLGQSSLLGGSPGTDGKVLEADAVIFYAPVDYQRRDLSFLRGKAVIHYGTDFTPHDHYRRLMEAEPAFVLFSDLRYPEEIPTADGLIPDYVRRFGAVPSTCVALREVWNWTKNGLGRIRLCVNGGGIPGESVNIIAEFPGNCDAGIIVIGAHLDSQAGTVGADDNASGMVFQLALARELRELKLRHTIRYIAFGAEEQLSVGSRAYVLRHWQEIAARGRFMINADSCGSRLGWDFVTYFTGPEIRNAFDSILNGYGRFALASFTPTPFIDLMPFGACGVPGMWLSRRNCASGRFQHHRPDDAPENVSPELIVGTARAVADLIREIDSGDIVIPPIPPAMAAEIMAGWQEYFAGDEKK